MRIFDLNAETYDAWYDSEKGRAIFSAELKCLRSLCICRESRWLEVGTGTGRFAHGLGIRIGIDRSLPMLRIAAGRGIAGCAENLPLLDDSINGILLAMSLCFIADPGKALNECRRVLRPGGFLLLGIVPAESPWGLNYQNKKAAGHPFYSQASFFGFIEIMKRVKNAGFIFEQGASSLFWHPDELPEPEPRAQTGVFRGAGFLGLLFSKTRHMGTDHAKLFSD